MGHLFIRDLQPGRVLDEVYMVTQPVLRNTSRGDLYIAMYLSDKTGKANCRMWQATEELYASIPTEGFLRVQGKSEMYQNSIQIVANKVSVVDSNQVNFSDYMPRTEKNIREMFEEVTQMMSEIQNPELGRLIGAFLSDTDLMRNFCKAPAAMQMHHNYIGGLLEHTHNMLRVAKQILPLYPKIQGDLIYAAILLHDLAKTIELSYDVAFSYTNSGQLVGHLVQGVVLIEKKAQEVAEKFGPIDRDILDNLIHIIVSHHGKYEFGSPKLPATPEAYMVNYIDDLDAKMNQVFNKIEGDTTSSDWTPWENSLQTRIFKKRVIDEAGPYEQGDSADQEESQEGLF